jgi:hypothetical protein
VNSSDIWPLICSQTFSQWTSYCTRNKSGVGRVRFSPVLFPAAVFDSSERSYFLPAGLPCTCRPLGRRVCPHIFSRLATFGTLVCLQASLTLHMAGHSHAPHRPAITDALSLVFFRLIKSFDTLFGPRDLFIYYEGCRHRPAGKFGSH